MIPPREATSKDAAQGITIIINMRSATPLQKWHSQPLRGMETVGNKPEAEWSFFQLCSTARSLLFYKEISPWHQSSLSTSMMLMSFPGLEGIALSSLREIGFSMPDC